MKVMGFDDLVLVAPRWADVLRREETIQRASGAADVLENARIVDTLDEALDGMTHLCATAMTPRDFGPPTARAARALRRRCAHASRPQRVAFLFGSERFGMANEDVYRCHACLSIPDQPAASARSTWRGGAGDRLRVAPGAGRLRRAGRAPPSRALADAAAGGGHAGALGAGAGAASASSTRPRPRS